MEEQRRTPRKTAPSKSSAPRHTAPPEKPHGSSGRTDGQHSHKHPRKKGFNYMKKKNVVHGFSVISLMGLVPVFFITALLLIVIPRSDISYIEKRKLATFPEFSFESYFSGEFTAKVTEFYDDTVPDRDNFKTAGYNIKSLFGLHTEEAVKFVGNPVAVVNDKDKKDSSKQTSKTTPSNNNNQTTDNNAGKKTDTADKNLNEQQNEEVQKVNKEKDEYKEASNGLIVVKHEGHYRGLELFGGGEGEAYVQALNNFQSDLGDKMKIYSVTASTASEFYLPPDYEQYSVSQKETMDKISQKLDSNIRYVDIISALGKHVNEDIYLRTDHHWSSLGAYYAAQEFAKVAGVPFKDISTYKKVDVTDQFSGTLAAWSADADLTNDTELFSYYIPDNYDKCTTTYYTTSLEEDGTGGFFNQVGFAETAAYLTFMGGDELVVKVNTNVKNGRKLMIVKDSYGNAVPGFLFGSFEEICVVDMRYFNRNLEEFAQEEGITDLAFVMVSFSAVGVNADNLEVLRTQ